MPTNAQVTTPAVQDNPQNMLSALLNLLPLIAVVTGAVGLVITALVANQLSNELGFPTLLPTIMGNFEVGYALMIFLLSVLIFSAPITTFMSDKDRELATFTWNSMWLLWGGFALFAVAPYVLTTYSPEQENYWIIGFVLVCGFLLSLLSNNPALQSEGKTSKIIGYILRGFIFLMFFCMCLISFFIPLDYIVHGIPGWIPNGQHPFYPGMTLVFLTYALSALVFSIFYFKGSKQNSESSFPYIAITLLLLASLMAILISLSDKQIQNGILAALNERVDVPLGPLAQKTLCGFTVSTASNYLLINYKHGKTTYWACYSLNNNKLLRHGTMPSKQFIMTVWPNRTLIRSGPDIKG